MDAALEEELVRQILHDICTGIEIKLVEQIQQGRGIPVCEVIGTGLRIGLLMAYSSPDFAHRLAARIPYSIDGLAELDRQLAEGREILKKAGMDL